MQLTWAALVLGTLSLDTVLAHSSAAHAHHHLHRRRPLDLSGVDFSKINYGAANEAAAQGENVYDPANAAKFALPGAKVNTASAPAGADGGDGGSDAAPTKFTPISNKFGQPSNYIPTENPILDRGNVGSPYGSNIIPIADDDEPNFHYTANYINNLKTPVVVGISNKGGRDGKPNDGSFEAPVVLIKVGPGQNQWVAFQEGTQCFWIVNPGEHTSYGMDEGVWGEAELGSWRNKGASGYDVSNIPDEDHDSPWQEITSDRGERSATDFNDYNQSNKDEGGIGGNIQPGPLQMKVNIGHPE